MMDDPNRPSTDNPTPEYDPYATGRADRTEFPNPTVPDRPYRTTQSMAVQRRASRRLFSRQNLIGGCVSIGGAFFAFGCVALILVAILFPPWLRQQDGEIKEIWRSRFERMQIEDVYQIIITPIPTEAYILPTPVGVPTLSQDAMSTLLAPQGGTPQASPTPSESSSSGAGIGGGSALTPQAGTATEQSSLPTATPSPSTTPTTLPTIAPTATLTPTSVPIPASYRLNTNQLRYQAQTWNNCSGATLSMGLSYFGYWPDQQIAADFLKPNRQDKNVSPYQLIEYVNQSASQYSTTPVRALYRVGGDLQLLKTLIANEFPVIIEKGYEVRDLGWMGHYLLMAGYDDADQTFYTYDSYLGAGRAETYSDTEYYWRHFNYTFVVIYPPDREAQLMQLLGALADPNQAAEIARERAAFQVQANQRDAWALFNLGMSYTMLGNYEQAALAFDQAFTAGMPWRTLWYLHAPYTAYFALGRYDDILSLALATENSAADVEETYYYRGAVYAVQGNTQAAVNEFNKALTYNRNFEPARQALIALQNGTFNRNMVLSVGIGLSG